MVMILSKTSNNLVRFHQAHPTYLKEREFKMAARKGEGLHLDCGALLQSFLRLLRTLSCMSKVLQVAWKLYLSNMA